MYADRRRIGYRFGRRLTRKEHWRQFWNDGNAVHLDLRCGYAGVNSYNTSSSNGIFKINARYADKLYPDF